MTLASHIFAAPRDIEVARLPDWAEKSAPAGLRLTSSALSAALAVGGLLSYAGALAALA